MKGIKAICFGEVLMDLLPDGPRVGGAPLNVAINLQKLGLDSVIISKVGEDEYGKILLDFIKNKGLDIRFIQKDYKYPSGTVKVDFKVGEPFYEVEENLAWDYIEEPDLKNDEDLEFIIHGSLAARSEFSRTSLTNLISHHPAKIVFDLNLRKPFYKREIILKLFRSADILKFNEYEFEILSEWLKLKKDDTNIAIGQMLTLFPKIDAVLLTMGAKGATLKTRDEYFHVKAFDVDVVDTIGSGDAFLAAFLSKFKTGDMDYAMNFASATAALVASNKGANPDYDASDIENLLSNS